jgi:predicted DNA-binding transcriptional regulator AlpA
MSDSPTDPVSFSPFSGEMLDAKRLVPQAEVERRVDKRKSWIFAELANPDSDFPRPIKCGRSNSWLLSEVLNWIDARILERDLAATPSEGCRGLRS